MLHLRSVLVIRGSAKEENNFQLAEFIKPPQSKNEPNELCLVIAISKPLLFNLTYSNKNKTKQNKQ